MAAQGKDYNVYMAKMAEQAERYDEMADFMKVVSEFQVRNQIHNLLLLCLSSCIKYVQLPSPIDALIHSIDTLHLSFHKNHRKN